MKPKKVIAKKKSVREEAPEIKSPSVRAKQLKPDKNGISSSKSVETPSAPTPPARRKKLSVPAILLEGDRAPSSDSRGPGQKFALGPRGAESVTVFEEAGDLPEAYGTGSLILTARDPHWIYAHWDFTREQLSQHNKASRDGHLVLRVFVDVVAGEPLTEIHVHPESRNWFVHVGQGGTRYAAEIGYYTPVGKWQKISLSRPTITPPDKLSDDTTTTFETIPVGLPFEALVTAVRGAAQENLPLAQAIQHLRESGFDDLPDAEAIASSEWSPEQAEAMTQIITMDHVRRVWMGSLEITELLRRQLNRELSSAAAAQFSSPSSQSLGSLSSPFGGQDKQRSFWFNVNAELIVYGATEPDAKVVIGGRRIQLRDDGTFSYRFALPDGSYPLPISATSSDAVETRSADLHFSRTSRYRGDVGKHPQNPELLTPDPQNVS